MERVFLPLLVLTDDSIPLPPASCGLGAIRLGLGGIMAYVMLLIIPAVIFIVTEVYRHHLTGGETKG